MPGPSEASSAAPKSTVKFLCSYGGKILPRYPDGKLRYLGGHTRVLAVDRTISFSELMLKMEELCGSAVRHLRCQLPVEDLDALVSITSDEDLVNLIEEYDCAASLPPPLKIRAFLSPPRSPNKISASPPPPHSKSAYSSCSSSASASSSSSSSSSSFSSYISATGGGCGGSHGYGSGRRYKVVAPMAERCVHQMRLSAAYPVASVGRSGRRNIPVPRDQGNSGYVCLIHNGNHWQ